MPGLRLHQHAERQHPAVPQRRDAKLLQVVSRQVRQDRLVDVVLAEHSLVLSEAKAPQPDYNVHDGGLSLRSDQR